MRLIAITTPDFREGEADAICRLLDCGWERVHIRKPGASKEEIAGLIREIPSGYYPHISLHDYFELADDFGLGGVHLNGRNPIPPTGWKGLVSRSCHSIEEIEEYSGLDYLTLSPIFDSISKPGYKSRFTPESLKNAVLGNVFALGGVTFSRLAGLEAAGFAGAAMLAEAWKTEYHMLQFITHTDEGLEEVLKGGCRWVQLRMKEAPDSEFSGMARRIVPLCRKYAATVILDDRVHLVKTLDADGVHLGKTDMPVKEARELLGHGKIIGATANTIDDIKHAYEAGADYIGLGPFRFTTTKKGLSPLLGIDGYKRIMSGCRQLGIPSPVVAIGGITPDDLPALQETGVSGVAISGLILNSEDKEHTTKTIIDLWKN